MCAEVFPFGDVNLSDWPVAVAATLSWRYTAANGNLVAETPLVPGSTEHVASWSPTSYNALVAVLWERQQWTVRRIDANSLGTSVLGNALCTLGGSSVEKLYADLSTHEAGVYSTAQEATFMAPRPADGCYLTYQRGTLAGKMEPEAGFLFRLGLLFAANAQAQRLFPKLPVADTRDRDIIRQTGAPDQS